MTTHFHGSPYGYVPPPPGPAPIHPLPFHRMALTTGRHRWWRPVAGTAVVFAGAFFLMLVLIVASEVAGAVLNRPTDDVYGTPSWGGIGDMALALLSIAVAIPVVFLAAHWVQRRPAGTVSSVTGRLRWRWLGMCLVLALPLVVGSMGVLLLLPESGGGGAGAEEMKWVGLPSFLLGLAMVCVIVPFQAAAEEYVCRGWLLQAVGAWFRSPWIAVLPQAVLFAAAHGWGTPWGFADLVVFGLVMGVLTIRTGGLEAAIALHVLNNLLGLGIAAGIAGALESEETAADMDWMTAAVDIPVILLYAVVVLWMARRRRISTVSAPSAEPPAHTASPAAWHGAYGMPPGTPPGVPPVPAAYGQHPAYGQAPVHGGQFPVYGQAPTHHQAPPHNWPLGYGRTVPHPQTPPHPTHAPPHGQAPTGNQTPPPLQAPPPDQAPARDEKTPNDS